ncbi:hypothetical protein DFJ74DRAFT_366684 [Hyaloraphidium curvatum]|nr:hypothetical protein DFJ74DRAFT_366684 [Hyaloraphidium curvatum]
MTASPPDDASSGALPPWPLSELVLLGERLAPYTPSIPSIFIASTSLLSLLPVRESLRRREPLRALVLLASAAVSAHYHLLKTDLYYHAVFGEADAAGRRPAREAEAGMYMKLASAVTLAVYLLAPGEGSAWIRKIFRAKPDTVPRRPLGHLVQIFFLLTAGADFVPKDPTYNPIRVALSFFSYVVWWMLTWVTLWRGWVEETAEPEPAPVTAPGVEDSVKSDAAELPTESSPPRTPWKRKTAKGNRAGAW